MIVGRSAEADLRIDSEELSRKHMLIVRSADEFACEDMDSRNGIFLNGVKIHSATLRDKDTLQLGAVVLVYHEGG
jgi:pSer/pThr/pTyr-binding forkhead associated (FHA) protein